MVATSRDLRTLEKAICTVKVLKQDASARDIMVSDLKIISKARVAEATNGTDQELEAINLKVEVFSIRALRVGACDSQILSLRRSKSRSGKMVSWILKKKKCFRIK